MFKPIVTEELTDEGMVFLFHVGLVVFEVGPGAGLVTAMYFEPMMQVEVQKLAAIFAIPSEQVEWLNFPDRLQCL